MAVLSEPEHRSRQLLAGAIGFLFAAKATHAQCAVDESEPMHWPAITVNVCFAIEIAQKAFLSARGATEGELIALRHNLSRGFEKVIGSGYLPPHPAISDVISILSPLHNTSGFRYLDIDYADLPDERNMIAIANAHVFGLGDQMGAGLTPS